MIEQGLDRPVPEALPEEQRAVGLDDRAQPIPMSLFALAAPDQESDETGGAWGGRSEVQPLSIGPELATPAAEQSQSRARQTPDVSSAHVSRVAFVREEGLNLRSGPSQTTSSMGQLPFGTRVHVLEDEARQADWQKVTTSTGNVGYLYAKQVHFPPPDLIARDPGLRLIRVQPGQTMWGLVRQQYGIQGNESTADQNMNHFINAIRAVNKSEAFTIETDWMDAFGNWAISGRDASDTLLRAGYDLWIPSFGVAAGMDVGSGTVTGEIARLIKKIEQKLKDFRDAGAAAGKYIPAAVAAHVGEAASGLIHGLVDFALDAVKILAISTLVGALIGALFGGAGALPGAEIGFEIGLLILEAYGLAMLIELILSMAGQLLGQLGSFVRQAWEANGDPKKIEDAGKTLAEAIGVLAVAALLAAVAYLMKKGGEALAKTKFAKTIGQTELAKYMSDRANMKSTNEALAPKEPVPTTGGKGTVPPVVRSRGASGSGTGENFKLEDHPTVREPVVETRPGTARPTRPTTTPTKQAVKPPPRPTRGSTPEDVASVHAEATEHTGRGGRSPSDPEELSASPDRRLVGDEDVAGLSAPRRPSRPSGATPPPGPKAPPGARRAWLRRRLQQHVDAARQRFEAEGYTPKQELDVRANPRSAAMHRGSRIDAFAKESVMNDPDLASVITAPDFIPEPDFIDSALKTPGDDWFDATTTGSWQAHLRKYGARYGRGVFLDAGPTTPRK
ncbi:DUF6861 domain-containing protein [Terrabacter sp. RAF57]|uniref:DUF6861 domain-containing protein n=1 Tax=Terrabacter sp. RAF57 TaxID=3233063 RepID=UPI003F9DD565